MNRAYEKGLVNVLVPCYNGEAYINRFFRSFEKQTYLPIELILVNDGSTDESDALIRKEIETLSPTGIRVNYIVQENRGLGGAINRAMIRSVKPNENRTVFMKAIKKKSFQGALDAVWKPPFSERVKEILKKPFRKIKRLLRK